jgi:hypothetical protein
MAGHDSCESVSDLPKDGSPMATASNATPILSVPPDLGVNVVVLTDVVVVAGIDVVVPVVTVDVLEQAGNNASIARIKVITRIQIFLFINILLFRS